MSQVAFGCEILQIPVRDVALDVVMARRGKCQTEQMRMGQELLDGLDPEESEHMFAKVAR